jgi:hypothetical protein
VAPAAGGDRPLELRGSLSTRYRGRWAEGADDHDLYEVLTLDVGDEREDRYTAHVTGRLSGDLDGRGDATDQAVFPSLADTFDGSVHGWLYQAYVDLERPPVGSQWRIGRQIDFLTPEFAHYDGVRISSTETSRRLQGGVYGGLPVRLYEATQAGDVLFGAWGEARPWRDGRVRADWMHVEDDDRFGDHSDDLLGLSVWQRFGERLRGDASYTRLEDRDRDLRLRASWDDAERDLILTASFYRLLDTQRDFADEFDPFFGVLHDYFPFSQLRLAASKGLSKRTRLEGGADLRRVDDSDDEGSFNRDYERGWAALVLLDRLLPGLTLTLTGDVWRSDDEDIGSLGIDATRELSDGLRVSAGTSYALYRYDSFLDRERDDVRVWYAKLRKKVGASWSFDLGYDLERDDGETFHSLLLGATWRF